MKNRPNKLLAPPTFSKTPRKRGLTLIELILAVTLLAVVMGVSYMSFYSGVRAWRAGTELSDSLNHADFVLEQVAMGIRSAYYPDALGVVGDFGMVLENVGGEGESARDKLSWVKLGTSLVGADSPVAATPHRVELYVAAPGEIDGEEFEDGGLVVRAWRTVALPDEFEPNEEIEPILLTPRATGLNFRMLDPENNLLEGDAPSAEDKLEWLDDWENDYTNRLPWAVEVTLTLPPPSDRDKPIEIKRAIEIPLAPLAWRDKGAAGGSKQTGGETKSKNKTTPRTQQQQGGTQKVRGNAGEPNRTKTQF